MPRRGGNRFENLNGVPMVASPPVLVPAQVLVDKPPVAPPLTALANADTRRAADRAPVPW